MDRIAREETAEQKHDRVVVFAPTGDDAELTAQLLGSRGLVVTLAADAASLIAELEAGAGLAIVTSEALHERESFGQIRRFLDRQEPWSDVPVLFLVGAGEAEEALSTEPLGGRAQIVVLERPVGIAPFLTAIDAALRGRRRQHEVRRLLRELADSASEVARVHEEAARAKDEFLATLAHELRSPMTAIRGWIGLLKTGELDATESAEAFSAIESSSTVQSHIIEDLMDVSRILAGKPMIEPTVTELRQLFAGVVRAFRPAAELQGVVLTEALAEEPLLAWADEVRLQQVLWNLLSNAVKFTPREGSIHVSMVREDGSAVVRVRDTGRGIGRDVLPYVFDRYRQEEGSDKKGGLGLGLAIVRHLVESHGGSIHALSEGTGKGAEFVVTLPLHVPGAAGS